MHPTVIEIDSRQFVANLTIIRQVIGSKVKLCLPVKANAYGHDLIKASQLAQEYVDYFGVACLDEGAILRQNGIVKPILVFGAIDEQQIPQLIENNLEITISSFFKAELVEQYCRSVGQRCLVHIKVDTGMSRVGVKPQTSIRLIDMIMNSQYLELKGLYSHLAASDQDDSSLTTKQIGLFRTVVDYARMKNPQILVHLANSAAVANYTDSYFSMVRPGIMSYGYTPFSLPNDSILQQIRPCFSLKTRVSYFKVVECAQGISYGPTYITRAQTRVITLPVGYGDGYRRGLSNRGEVLLRGKRYLISGLICMDMLMVDINSDEGYVGDEVVLIGTQANQEITMMSLADKLDTTIYEILVSFTSRIPRIFV